MFFKDNWWSLTKIWEELEMNTTNGTRNADVMSSLKNNIL